MALSFENSGSMMRARTPSPSRLRSNSKVRVSKQDSSSSKGSVSRRSPARSAQRRSALRTLGSSSLDLKSMADTKRLFSRSLDARQTESLSERRITLSRGSSNLVNAASKITVPHPFCAVYDAMPARAPVRHWYRMLHRCRSSRLIASRRRPAVHRTLHLQSTVWSMAAASTSPP